MDKGDKKKRHHTTCPKCGNERAVIGGCYGDDTLQVLYDYCFKCRHSWNKRHLVDPATVAKRLRALEKRFISYTDSALVLEFADTLERSRNAYPVLRIK